MLAGSVALLVAGCVTAVGGLEPFESAPDSRLRVEWETATRKAAPIVRGYVFNTYAMDAVNARLLVETLDAGDTVTGKQVGWVVGVVPNGNRAYFELEVPPAAGYRVRILAWDWFKSGP